MNRIFVLLGITLLVTSCYRNNAPAQATGAIQVSDVGVKAALNKKVRFTGTALRAKIAPAVRSESGMLIYCLGQSDWSSEQSGKSVTVTGTLERTDDFKAKTDPNSAVSAGTSGGDLVIRGCDLVD
jgi:hypothetical protein